MSQYQPGTVTDLDEAALAEFLFSDWTVHRFVLGALGFPANARVAHRVVAPFIEDPNARPGDIDVLLCGSAPDRATVLECKRVKVQPHAFETGLVNKLQELEGGAIQANGLLELGFHCTYLMLCVAVDGSQRAGYNFVGRGLTGELVREIYARVPWNLLDEWLGVLAIEAVQPTAKGIHLAAGIGLVPLRAPTPRTQIAALTALVGKYFTPPRKERA